MCAYMRKVKSYMRKQLTVDMNTIPGKLKLLAIVACVCMAAIQLSACGQKGSLYLPEEGEKQQKKQQLEKKEQQETQIIERNRVVLVVVVILVSVLVTGIYMWRRYFY